MRRRSALAAVVPAAVGRLGGSPFVRLPAAWQARGLEPRLVWIFGSPRSGSTWLLSLLCHPLIADDRAGSGVRRLEAPDADPPAAIPINEPYTQQHLAPTMPLELDAQDTGTEITLQEVRAANPSYLLSTRFEAAWRPALRQLVLARLAAQVDAVAREAHMRGDGPVVIKEPNGSIGAGFLMSLLPRSRMIFLLRDGRDVVDSMVDAQMPGGWLSHQVPERAQALRHNRLALVRRESHLWLGRTQAVKRAFDAHPPHLRRLVRYEQARSDPDAVLSELERWLGIPRSPAGHADALRWNDFDAIPDSAKGSGKPLRAATPGLWRENLAPDEQAAMAEIMGAQLAELGYA